MTDDSDQTLTLVPWRTGRKVHRTIYAQIGAEPSDLDILIGVMDTPHLAEAATRAHNDERARRYQGRHE